MALLEETTCAHQANGDAPHNRPHHQRDHSLSMMFWQSSVGTVTALQSLNRIPERGPILLSTYITVKDHIAVNICTYFSGDNGTLNNEWQFYWPTADATMFTQDSPVPGSCVATRVWWTRHAISNACSLTHLMSKLITHPFLLAPEKAVQGAPPS